MSDKKVYICDLFSGDRVVNDAGAEFIEREEVKNFIEKLKNMELNKGQDITVSGFKDYTAVKYVVIAEESSKIVIKVLQMTEALFKKFFPVLTTPAIPDEITKSDRALNLIESAEYTYIPCSFVFNNTAPIIHALFYTGGWEKRYNDNIIIEAIVEGKKSVKLHGYIFTKSKDAITWTYNVIDMPIIPRKYTVVTDTIYSNTVGNMYSDGNRYVYTPRLRGGSLKYQSITELDKFIKSCDNVIEYL